MEREGVADEGRETKRNRERGGEKAKYCRGERKGEGH
jgi:hypothetical protein